MENIENMETIADINSPLNGNNLGTDMNILPRMILLKRAELVVQGHIQATKIYFS